MIHIRILGVPSATGALPAAQIAPLLAGKPLALLAYLACAPASSATRARLVDLLWSDVELEAGKHALRQTLWYVKRRLGEGVVLAENDHLLLAPDYQCDRTEFLVAVDRGDFEGAVSLYTGPFFPNFAAPGGAEFERWADVERAHLCGKFVRASEDVCRRWLHKGNTRPAVALARRARDADPENESLWRLVIECLLAASDRVGAASEADALARKLSEDEREPEVATNALLRSARANGNHHPELTENRATLFAELVGREHEFSRIISAWERTRDSAASHIHLTAPAGIGKTRLIADIEARLRASRARVVRLRAAPGERTVPYALAAELAVSLARLRGAAGVSPGATSTLLALNPQVSTWLSGAPDTTTGDDVLRRRALAMQELLAAVSSETPVALLIDDLHWADSETLLLLNSIASRLQNMSVLLVTASRPPVPFPTDGTMLEMVGLQPLDGSQVGAMLASIAKLPDEAWADAFAGELHSATGGSPLLVLEMLQYALDRERLRIDGGVWQCPDSGDLVRDMRPGRALERRIAELDSAARKVLLVLALAGIPTTPFILAQAIGRSEHDAEATLVRLEAGGLAIRDGSSWLPQHDEIAAAVVAAADEVSRRDAQRGLATAYRESASIDPSHLRRSISHAIAATDDALIADLARRYVKSARERGDMRSAKALLREAVGSDVAQSMVQGLNATLPPFERFALRRKLRYAGGVAVAAFAVAAAVPFLNRSKPLAENTLLAEMLTDAGSVFKSIELFDTDLDTELPLQLETHANVEQDLLEVVNWHNPEENIGRTEWVAWHDRADSNRSDPELVVKNKSGAVLPIARSAHDDIMPTWTPDGGVIAYLSRQWSQTPGRAGYNNLDIGLFHVATGRQQQLTATNADELHPRPSPDGTRIAFGRSAENNKGAICVLWIDNRRETCQTLDGFTPSGSNVWRTNNVLIFAARPASGTPSTLLRWSLASGLISTVHTGAVNYDISPDGRLVVFDQQVPGSADTRRYVASIDHMDRRRLLMTADGIVSRIRWRASRRQWRAPARIELGSRSGEIAMGVPTQINGIAYDASEQLVPDANIQFATLDSTVATVSDAGVVTARKKGVVQLIAASGAILRDTLSLTVVMPTHAPQWEERWESAAPSQWIAYGLPAPHEILADRKYRALNLVADSNYSSGMISLRSLDATNGAGVEILASTRLTRQIWQTFAVVLQALPDSSKIAVFRNTDFGMPSDWQVMARNATCTFGVPSGEGRIDIDRLSIGAGGEPKFIPGFANATDGSWHRWRIQILPDGRCAFALDGIAIWISNRAINTNRRMSVVLDARVVGTEILAGPVATWTGVAPGVDWTAIDTISARKSSGRPQK